MKKITDTNILSLIMLITSVGDFITKFAFVKIVYTSGHSIFISSTIVIIEAAARSLGGISSPFLQRFFPINKILLNTQLISAFFSMFLLLTYLSGITSPIVLGAISFVLYLLRELFEENQEVQSKAANDENHIENQSKLLSGLYRAQFLGPLISLGLMWVFPLWVPLFLDFVSFFLAYTLLRKLELKKIIIKAANPFRPFIYIWEHGDLAKVFLLRSVGFYLGAGIVNYLMYIIVADRHNQDPTMTAWIYSALGFGGSLAAFLVPKINSIIPNVQDKHFSIIGHVGMAIMLIFFSWTTSISLAVVAMSVHGIFMGIFSINSKAIRRRLTNPSTLSEIQSAEILVGQISEFSIMTVVLSSLSINEYNISRWMMVAALITAVIGLMYFSINSTSKDND